MTQPTGFFLVENRSAWTLFGAWEPPSSKLAAMIFYQLLLSPFWMFHSKCRVFTMKFSGISSPALKKKSPPTSRGSRESTQRFYPNESQAQAFSIQYPHLDTTSWICLAVGIADTQGGPRIRFRKEVLGGLGGVLRGGFITWNEHRFCFTIPATIARKTPPWE